MSNWDNIFEKSFENSVNRWVMEIGKYGNIGVPRNVFGAAAGQTELHLFCDASENGHGAVGYLRVVNPGSAKCSFLWGKGKVNPLKAVSIPRLELVAAVLAWEEPPRGGGGHLHLHGVRKASHIPVLFGGRGLSAALD